MYVHSRVDSCALNVVDLLAAMCCPRGVASALLLAFGFSSAPVNLRAQNPTAAITGVVTDSGGAPVENAAVVARDAATGLEYRATTSSAGRYWIRAVPGGTYQVIVRAIGFRAIDERGTIIPVGASIALDFVLARATVALAPIVVEATRRMVPTTVADVSHVIDRERLARLPEESRRFIDLAQLAPGATIASSVGTIARFGTAASVGGLNANYLGIHVDGGDFTESAFGELSGGVPLLAIQEFAVVMTQYAASFGRAASGAVNVITRRGGNMFAFESFGMFRDRSLNARGAFESEKPDFNRAHWGFAAGGPIVRDRTHFFAAVERKVANDFATVATGGVFPQYEGTFKTPFTDNLLFARLDHRLGADHDVSIRYVGDVGERRAGIGPCAEGSVCSADAGYDARLRTHSVLASHRWELGNGYINDARLHLISRQYGEVPVSPVGPQLCRPSLCTGPAPEPITKMNSSRVELRNELSFAPRVGGGGHHVRVGAQLSWQHNDIRFEPDRDGLFFFESDTAALPVLGLIGYGSPFSADSRNTQIGAYVDDSWNPSRNLAINLGLRYDVETNGSNQDFVSPFAGSAPFIRTTPRPIDKNNIAPRVSVAWHPTGSDGTVIRGGFGVFYNAFVAYPLLVLERTSGFRAAFVPNPGTTDVTQIPLDPDDAPPFIWPLAAEVETPYTRQFSLGFDRQLPWNTRLRVDGVFAQGRNLLLERQLNTYNADDEPAYPQYAFIGQVLTRGESDTRMLIVEARKSMTRGWAEVSYTLANRKNTNDAWNDFVSGPLDPDDTDFSRLMAPADWDERHRVVLTAGADLGAGVDLTLKAIHSSPRPFNPVSAEDLNRDLIPGNDVPPPESRNGRRGSTFSRVDLGLRWTPALRGRVRPSLIVNAYNVLNRTNFDPTSVVGVLESPLFGKATTAFAARQIEAGVSLRW